MPKFTKRDVQPPRHPPPDVVDAIIGADDESPMRASESAAALRAMGEVGSDAVELDEMERLTRALDPPRTPEQPRHERPFVTPEEETKDLAEPARWAPCPVEQRKWSHSIVVLNPSDLRYGHEPGGMARKEGMKRKRRRWLLAGLVVVMACAGALGYVFGVSSDKKKKRSSSVETPSSMPSSAPSSSAPAPEPSPKPSPSPSVKPGNPTASPVIAPTPHPTPLPSRTPSSLPTTTPPSPAPSLQPTLTHSPTPTTGWARFTVDASLRGADGSHLADADGDGFLDLAIPWEESGVVAAYLNPGNLQTAWPRVVVANLTDRTDLLSQDGVEDAEFVDLDGDGLIDIVSCAEAGGWMAGKVGSWGAGFVRLHFAPSDMFDEWTTLELLEGVGKWMASSSTDVDGDSRTDVIIGSKESPVSVAVLKQGSDARDATQWTYVPISSSIEERWVMSLAAHDVDGDGLVDAVVSFRGTKDGPGVFWLENPGTLDGSDWPHHRMLGDVSMRVMMLDLVDLYGTGSVDVVVAEERTGVVVLEAPSGDKTQAWSSTHLRCDVSDIDIGTTVKSVTAGDLDGDGAPELVISCEDATDEKLGVFYLRRDPSQPWTAQCDPIDVAGQDGAKFDLVRVADVDGDGAADVVTSEEGLGEDVGLGVVWYRNPGP